MWVGMNRKFTVHLIKAYAQDLANEYQLAPLASWFMLMDKA